MAQDGKELTVSDIEYKIQERMEYLERNGELIKLKELGKLMNWILCGDDY